MTENTRWKNQESPIICVLAALAALVALAM